MAEWSEISISSYVIKKGSDLMSSQYVSYTVQAKRKEATLVTHTTERRFNDFVLLQKEIAKEHPGSIIAPLPKDQVFGRFKPEFIESRMRGLEECLRKLYSDSDISKSCCWTPFFTHTGNFTVETSQSGDAAPPSSSWLSSVQKLAAPVLVNPYLDTAEMDDHMKEVECFVQANTKSMHRLALAAADLADKTSVDARVLKTLSEVCTAIGSNCEDEDDEFMRQFGLSIGSFSLGISRSADEQVVQVKEPLEQQARVLLAVTGALRRQKKLKSNFVACAADAILRQKAEQKDPANVSKIESSRSGRAAVVSARKEYLEASQALLHSFDSLREARLGEVLAAAEALGEVELSVCEKQGHVLADLLDELTCDGA